MINNNTIGAFQLKLIIINFHSNQVGEKIKNPENPVGPV